MMGFKRSVAILSLLLMLGISNAEKSASEFGRRSSRRRRSKGKGTWKYAAGGVVAGMAVSSMLKGRRRSSYGYGRSSSYGYGRSPSYGYGRSPSYGGGSYGGGRSPQLHGRPSYGQPQAQDMIKKYLAKATMKASLMKQQTCGQTPEQCKFNIPVKYFGNAEERLKMCLSFKDKNGDHCCMSQRFIYYGVDSCVPLTASIEKRQAILNKLSKRLIGSVNKQVKAGNVGKGTRQPVDILSQAADQHGEETEETVQPQPPIPMKRI